jgi:hypothetical protein
MLSIEDIKLYLPKYLSPETEAKLLADLDAFPESVDARFYGFIGKEAELLYQGDGVKDLPVVNLPDPNRSLASCLVISNTCDIDLQNRNKFPANVVYSPIISLKNYSRILLEEGVYTQQAVADHLNSIRHQQITQIFYLPAGQYLPEESIVFFDRLVSCSNGHINRQQLAELRLFSLSQLGHYVLLFKLSIHFTRIAERVDRKY